MTSDSILEHLRLKMGCSYISDLRRLTGKERKKETAQRPADRWAAAEFIANDGNGSIC